jgi:hypothetical protein
MPIGPAPATVAVIANVSAAAIPANALLIIDESSPMRLGFSRQ